MSIVSVEAGAVSPQTKYDRLAAAAKHVPSVVTIVVHPCDETSLSGACEAAEISIIKPVLVGPAARIEVTAAR
jgi:phosphate acetyltransferase